MMRGPFMEEFGFGSKESHIMAMEFPRMLERVPMHTLDMRKAHPSARRKSQS
jgi:hypothetical protein